MLRLPDADELPPTDELIPEPEEIEELVVEQVGNSAMFASLFRENASRALLLPRRRPGKRTALWQQRLRAKNLLAVARRYSDFPVVLETYRQCLRDVFDMPALIDLLAKIRSRDIVVQDVETQSASPFARSLVYAFVGQNLYDLDSPLAERRAQALTLDRGLLRELLGQEELRDLLDLEVIELVEAELQGQAYDWRARNPDQLHDLLRRVGDLSLEALATRTGIPGEYDASAERPESSETFEAAGGAPTLEWLESLIDARRAVRVRVADEERFVAAEDAALYRDALGVMLPPGLPDTLLEEREAPFEALLWRFARSHGPFTSAQLGEHFGLLAGQVEPVLENLERQGRLYRGEIRPGGSEPEWCEPEVLRKIKRRTLARLRREVAPVDRSVLGRFLPRWQEVRQAVSPAGERSSGVEPPPAVAPAVRGGNVRRITLEDAIGLLEGVPLPWSTLNGIVLPARVEGYEPSMLDLLAATGEVVWVGRSALGSKDGKVSLYLRDHVEDLLAVDSEYEPPTSFTGQSSSILVSAELASPQSSKRHPW